MAGRARTLVQRPRSQKRKAFWIGLGGVTGTTGVAASTTLLHASLNAAALALRPFTVVRSVGSLYISSDQSAATEQVLGAFGNAIADDRAVSVGATAIPRPYTDISDSDWFQWGSFSSRFTFKDATGFQGVQVQRVDWDQKGQRKIALGSDIIQVIENISGLGLVFIWTQRLLCLAH